MSTSPRYGVPEYLEVVHFKVSLNIYQTPNFGVPEYLQGLRFMMSLIIYKI